MPDNGMGALAQKKLPPSARGYDREHRKTKNKMAATARKKNRKK
jgi:hypothetical protein